MANPSFTTELEAVNTMLRSIGLSPVPSLEYTGIEDVGDALNELRNQTRSILTKGWDFNTDEGYELTPDPSGFIKIPNGALEVDLDDTSKPVVLRRHPTEGMCLWDKSENTWTFDEPVECEIIWAYDFEDLPQTARDYIGVSAARRFQQGKVGAQILDRFDAEHVTEARLAFERREAKSRDANIFRDNPRIAGSVNNRRY